MQKDDVIYRQAAIDAINHICPVDTEYDCTLLDRVDVRYVLSDLPSAEQWHVIKKRPMTNDERIEWSEEIGHDIEDEDAFIYFNLPDDGEEVLVSTQFGLVYIDTFCQDEGCYFEENGDMDGIVAWMEKPKPYRGDKE